MHMMNRPESQEETHTKQSKKRQIQMARACPEEEFLCNCGRIFVGSPGCQNLTLVSYARAAAAKSYKLSGLNSRNVSSRSSGGWSPRSWHWQHWFFLRERTCPKAKICPRPLFLSCTWLVPPWVSSHCPLPVHACLCIQMSPFYKDNSHIGFESSLMASFYCDRLCKDPVSKQHHIMRYWESPHVLFPGGGGGGAVVHSSIYNRCTWYLFHEGRLTRQAFPQSGAVVLNQGLHLRITLET